MGQSVYRDTHGLEEQSRFQPYEPTSVLGSITKFEAFTQRPRPWSLKGLVK